MKSRYLYFLINGTLCVGAWVLMMQGRSVGFTIVVIAVSGLLVNCLVYFSLKNGRQSLAKQKQQGSTPGIGAIIGLGIVGGLLYFAGSPFSGLMCLIGAAAFLVIHLQAKRQQ